MEQYLGIIRPVNSLMSAFSVIVVSLSIGKFDTIKVILGMLVTFLTTAGGNVINDYFDYEIDKINHPERPIPSGKIKRVYALYYSISLFSLSIIFSVFLGILPVIIDIIAVFLLITYEYKTKNIGFTGNLQISFLIFMLFIFTGSIYSDFYLPTLIGIMAMLTNLSREITKDVEDLEGDINRVTLPKRIGIKNSLLLSTLFTIVAVILSPLPFILKFYNIYYIIVVAIADMVFIYASYVQWKDQSKGQKYLKIGMVIALVSFFVGGLVK